MSYTLEDYETLETKRIFQSKYSRPIDFIPGSNELNTVDGNRNVAESAKSTGDEVASFYRNIISAPSKSTVNDNKVRSEELLQSKASSSSITNAVEHDTRQRSMTDVADRKTPSTATNEESWYCEFCDMTIPIADHKRHIQGTAHMVSSSQQYPPAPDILTIDAKNVGFKMLRSQGWRYEEGLGAEGQGRRHPIATVLKQDRLAVGHKQAGKKVITHKHSEIEKKAILRQRALNERQKDPGKVIAKRAKAESKQRVALLHYLKD